MSRASNRRDGLRSLQPLSLHPVLSIHGAPAELLLASAHGPWYGTRWNLSSSIDPQFAVWIWPFVKGWADCNTSSIDPTLVYHSFSHRRYNLNSHRDALVSKVINCMALITHDFTMSMSGNRDVVNSRSNPSLLHSLRKTITWPSTRFRLCFCQATE